jgi:hypothetical protein
MLRFTFQTSVRVCGAGNSEVNDGAFEHPV